MKAYTKDNQVVIECNGAIMEYVPFTWNDATMKNQLADSPCALFAMYGESFAYAVCEWCIDNPTKYIEIKTAEPITMEQAVNS